MNKNTVRTLGFKNNKSGFTLIELLVVSTIIVVLATIGLVSFTNAGKSARDGKRKADVETIRQALTLYKQQNTSYPSGSIDTVLDQLKGSYVSEPVPQDPKTSNPPYTYSGGGTTFCVCATMESGRGNTNSLCPGISNITNGTHYCAKNL